MSRRQWPRTILISLVVVVAVVWAALEAGRSSEALARGRQGKATKLVILARVFERE
jgi:hypothetical protein